MHIAFLVALVTCSLYYLLARRPIDFLTVGFGSSVIYFLPGIVGYTLTPTTPGSPIKLPVALDPEVYAIMRAGLVGITFGTVVYDLRQRARSTERKFIRLEQAPLAAWIAAALGVLGFLMTWLSSEGSVFNPDKRVVMESVGRWHILWEMSASFSVLFGMAYRRPVCILVGVALVLIDMYVGFRYAFALTFVSCLVYKLSELGPVIIGRLKARYWIGALLGGIMVISYQNLKAPIRAGDWAEVGTRVSSLAWWGGGILTSEPFTTQTILNEIVSRDFRTDTDHLVSSVHQFIMFAPQLGAESVRFGDIYQPSLFPLVDHGLANNIWAQMWSAGGWLLLTAFILFHAFVLALGSRLLGASDPGLRVFVVLFFSYWAFYIHRNELLVQLGFQKQSTIVWAMCMFFGIILSRAAVQRRFASRTLSP